jgi:hypothetical protein
MLTIKYDIGTSKAFDVTSAVATINHFMLTLEPYNISIGPKMQTIMTILGFLNTARELNGFKSGNFRFPKESSFCFVDCNFSKPRAPG